MVGQLAVMRRGTSPLVTSSPQQKARLRPLRNPLVDTVKFVAATAYTKAEFYTNRRTFLDGSPKLAQHNNLPSDGQLGTPLEFDFIGLTFKPNYGTSLLNINTLYNAVNFRWFFHQNVQWLSCPLTELPGGMGPYGQTTELGATIFNNGEPSVMNFFNMADHLKQSRHIGSQENFKGILEMEGGFTAVAADVYVKLFMVGLLYGAL